MIDDNIGLSGMIGALDTLPSTRSTASVPPIAAPCRYSGAATPAGEWELARGTPVRSSETETKRGTAMKRALGAIALLLASAAPLSAQTIDPF